MRNYDWEQRKLGKVLHERKMRKKISEETPLLAFAAGQGVIDRSERKTNNRDFLTKDSSTKTYLFTKYDDIVYNPSNLKYGAIDRNKHGQGVISPIYVTFETEEISSFIELIVRGDSFKQRALQYEEGTVTKRQSVKPESLLSLNIALPISKKEQQKIGDFFKQLDDTIALHQRKLSLFNQLKETYLKRMFPQNEENMPVLRFADFSEPWEQRKLGEISDIVGGGTPSTSTDYYWNGNIDWYSPAEIGNQIFVNDSQKKITEAGLQKSSAKILPIGAVLFTSRAGIGNTAILAKEGATNQGFQSIIPHENELDSYFIYSRTHELKRYGELNGAGSTFIEVSGKQMAKMPILMPRIEEQIHIGIFFRKLDDTITLHQYKIKNLTVLKKVLLAKMFL